MASWWAGDETRPAHDYVYVGRSDKSIAAFVRPHPKGLVFEIVPKRSPDTKITFSTRPKRIIIPGQYTLKEAASFIAFSTGPASCKARRLLNGLSLAYVLRKRDISRALQESGIWKARGRIGWPDLPPKFFKVIPLKEFVKGSTHSYRTWWTQYMAKTLPRGAWAMKYRETKEHIASGHYLEKPSVVKGWDQLSLKQLISFNLHGVFRCPSWGQYIRQSHQVFYDIYLKPHGIIPSEPTMAYLNRCPKTKRFAELLNTAYNAGLGSASMAKLGFTKPKEIEDATDAARIFLQKRTGRKSLNANYQPPNIVLPAGWLWATHETFPGLSDLYSCCISNGFGYEEAVIYGRAHVMYRPDRSDGGALCFFRFRTTWHIGEMRSFANDREFGPPKEQYRNEATSVVTELDKLYPKGSAAVIQLEREEAMKQILEHPNPIYRRVFAVLSEEPTEIVYARAA